LTKVLRLFIFRLLLFSARFEARGLAGVVFQSFLASTLLHLRSVAVFIAQFLEFRGLLRAWFLQWLTPVEISGLISMI
jgi:hypothetical protein